MAQPTDQAPPPRRTHGCLLGCLAVILLLAAGGGAAFYFGGWYLTEGIKTDPSLQKAMTAVRATSVARDVLGADIQIVSVEREEFTATLGKGKTKTYTAMLKGSKGEAQLHVTVHSDGTGMKIVSMILTGSDGTRYNLTTSTMTPSPNSI